MASSPDGNRFPLRFPKMALTASVLLYLILATAIARTKAPLCDEGWFANPAYNLAFHGNMGSNVLEPSGHFLNAYLQGIRDRTYVVTANHLVGLAGWFRVVGFSLFTMRLYSIFWGAITLLALCYILRRLFPDHRVAYFATLLTALDFVFVWATADGRMEAPAGALALWSLAAYLHFRERSFRTAILVSQIFGAAAVFTHPNALIVLLAVFVLAWRYDRDRVRPGHLVLAVVPYLFFGLPWSVYILQAPSDFMAQFFANAAGRNSSRWKVVLQPWLAVYSEVLRHLALYMTGSLWSAVMNPAMAGIPFIYLAAMIGFLRRRKLHAEPTQVFTACLVTVLAGMTFLNGFKAHCYMLYAIPFYNAVLAAWLLMLWDRKGDAGGVAVCLGAAFVVVQLSTSIQHIRADEYAHDYQPAIRAVEEYQAAGKTIVGTAALGFGAGFRGFTDDWRLGLYTGLRPDVIVLDRSYRDFTIRFEKEEPAAFSHVVGTLNSEYRLAQRHGSFWIFERVATPRPRTVPRIDISSVVPNGRTERADYIFELLLGSGETQSVKDTHAYNAINF